MMPSFIPAIFKLTTFVLVVFPCVVLGTAAPPPPPGARVSCWKKGNNDYFWALPEFQISGLGSGWSRCPAHYDGDFWGFRTEQTGKDMVGNCSGGRASIEFRKQLLSNRSGARSLGPRGSDSEDDPPSQQIFVSKIWRHNRLSVVFGVMSTGAIVSSLGSCLHELS